MKIKNSKLLIQGKNENYEFDMVLKFRELNLMPMDEYDRYTKLHRYYKPILEKLIEEEKIPPIDFGKLKKLIKNWVKDGLYAGEKTVQEEYISNLIKLLKSNKIKFNSKIIVADDIVEGTIGREYITYPDADVAVVNKIETDLDRAKGGLDNEKLVSNVRRIIQKIKDLANNKSTTIMNFTDIISDHILALMKTTPQYGLEDRKEIYAFWEKIHGIHGSLIEEGESLIKALNDVPDLDKKLISNFKRTLESINKNNYVVQIEGIDVIDTDIEEQAEQLFTAFYNRKNSGNPQTVSLTSVDPKPKKYDILTALYVDTVLGGAFYDGDKVKIKELQKALTDYNGIFVGEDEKEFAKFTKELKNVDSVVGVISEKDAKEIEETGGAIVNEETLTKTYIPLMILSPDYLNTHYPLVETAMYVSLYKGFEGIQNVYKKLIMDTVSLFTVGKIQTGGAIRGKAVSGPQFKDNKTPPTYSETWGRKETEYRKYEKTMTDKLYDFILILKEYLIIPMETPKFSLGIDFSFTETTEYDALVVLSSKREIKGKNPMTKKINLSLKTRAMLHTKYSKSGPAIINHTSIVAIKVFLEELNKPFDFDELQVKAVDLISAMQKTMTTRKSNFTKEDFKDIKTNIESEIHSFINAIAVRINKDKNPPFNRTDIPLTDIKRLQEIHSFQILKDFIVKNEDSLKANRNNLNTIVQLINTIQTSDTLSIKLLSAHDGLRLIKGMPIHYGFKSLYSFEGVSSMVDELSLNHGIDITAMDIAKAVETIDSYESIGNDIGISEESVYIIKANFR